MGGQLAANVSREALVLEASFLREDLPFFAELLAEVVTMTKYTSKEPARHPALALPLRLLTFGI